MTVRRIFPAGIEGHYDHRCAGIPSVQLLDDVPVRHSITFTEPLSVWRAKLIPLIPTAANTANTNRTFLS